MSSPIRMLALTSTDRLAHVESVTGSPTQPPVANKGVIGANQASANSANSANGAEGLK